MWLAARTTARWAAILDALIFDEQPEMLPNGASQYFAFRDCCN